VRLAPRTPQPALAEPGQHHREDGHGEDGLPASDARDWDAIAAWANEIADDFSAAPNRV
jgi:hypothetical protein